MSYKGYGGKTIYGARVGILMLDTKWPRPPGDTGNALHVAVPGALQGRERRDGARRGSRAGQRPRAGVSQGRGGARQGRRRRHHDDRRLSRDFPEAARRARERAGRELVAHADPARAERCCRRANASACSRCTPARITPEHWDAVGAPHDTPVMGTENGTEFTRVMLNDEIELDYDLARARDRRRGRGAPAPAPGSRRDRVREPQHGAVRESAERAAAHSDLHRLHLRHVVPLGSRAARFRLSDRGAADVWRER